MNLRFNRRRWIGRLGAGVLLSAIGCAVAAGQAEREGLAVALVYDTSGSMSDMVRDAGGKQSPKYQIANRALTAIVHRLEHAVTNATSGPLTTTRVGLYTFSGSGATESVPFGPLRAADLLRWLRGFNRPSGPTPLGNAVAAASRAVLESGLTRKHVLVLTDGLNTAGPEPAAVLRDVQGRARGQGSDVAFHFVAFDINANQFAPLKALGATVVGAGDEGQLNMQLGFILEEKILLEAEDPAPKK